MPKYEVTFIFKKDEEKAEKIVEALFKKAEVKVVKKEDWKIKELAYPIAKQVDAHYLFYKIEASPNNILSLHGKIKLEEKIMRFLIVRVR